MNSLPTELWRHILFLSIEIFPDTDTPYTSFVNVAGLPAIALPVHVTADGLPMGVQLVGRPGGERTLLAIGAQLERRLRWQRRHPPQW